MESTESIRMPHAIFRQPTPEEAELVRRRAELAALRDTLATREAELAQLRAQLNSFEGRYIRQVGVLYIQLDEWEERIAELNSAPQIPEGAAASGRDPQSEAATQPLREEISAEASDADAASLSLDLKSLFREVAKCIHPDFATDRPDELRRTRLMAEANDAYNRDDRALLQRMLHGYDPSSGSGEDAEAAANLAGTLARIRQTEDDVALIDAEIKALAQSEMARLQEQTALAAQKGRDLLAEHAARVKGSIGMAMRRYELDLGRARRKEAALNPDSLLSAEK